MACVNVKVERCSTFYVYARGSNVHIASNFINVRKAS